MFPLSVSESCRYRDCWNFAYRTLWDEVKIISVFGWIVIYLCTHHTRILSFEKIRMYFNVSYFISAYAYPRTVVYAHK